MFDPRTRQLLDGPIAPTLLRLAAPNVVVMSSRIPSWGRMRWRASRWVRVGGLSNPDSSAIARALWGGRRGDPDLLVLHAILGRRIRTETLTPTPGSAYGR